MVDLNAVVPDSVGSWLHSPKTWIAGAALLFSLGGSATLFRQSLNTSETVLKENHVLILEHQEVSQKMYDSTKLSTEKSQQLLQEIVRLNTINCLNTSKDNLSRQNCVGGR